MCRLINLLRIAEIEIATQYTRNEIMNEEARCHITWTNHSLCLFLSVDIDDCAGRPCQNGGGCVDKLNGYICNCLAGFKGTNCTISKEYIRSFDHLYNLSSLCE